MSSAAAQLFFDFLYCIIPLNPLYLCSAKKVKGASVYAQWKRRSGTTAVGVAGQAGAVRSAGLGQPAAAGPLHGSGDPAADPVSLPFGAVWRGEGHHRQHHQQLRAHEGHAAAGEEAVLAGPPGLPGHHLHLEAEPEHLLHPADAAGGPRRGGRQGAVRGLRAAVPVLHPVFVRAAHPGDVPGDPAGRQSAAGGRGQLGHHFRHPLHPLQVPHGVPAPGGCLRRGGSGGRIAKNRDGPLRGPVPLRFSGDRA